MENPMRKYNISEYIKILSSELWDNSIPSLKGCDELQSHPHISMKENLRTNDQCLKDCVVVVTSTLQVAIP